MFNRCCLSKGGGTNHVVMTTKKQGPGAGHLENFVLNRPKGPVPASTLAYLNADALSAAGGADAGLTIELTRGGELVGVIAIHGGSPGVIPFPIPDSDVVILWRVNRAMYTVSVTHAGFDELMRKQGWTKVGNIDFNVLTAEIAAAKPAWPNRPRRR